MYYYFLHIPRPPTILTLNLNTVVPPSQHSSVYLLTASPFYLLIIAVRDGFLLRRAVEVVTVVLLTAAEVAYRHGCFYVSMF